VRRHLRHPARRKSRARRRRQYLYRARVARLARVHCSRMRGISCPPGDPVAGHTTTVSLVLGSGGARRLAHIGVIQWLTENGYDIRSIAGSSMGALVGGIYAAGKLEVYAEWVLALERLQVLRLLDPAFGRAGLFKGERIMAVLRELIGDFDIEHLPLVYTAVP